MTHRGAPSLKVRRRRRLTAVAVVGALAAMAARDGLAAQLPIDASALTAATVVGTAGVPTVFAWDNFDRATVLNSQPSPNGTIWKNQIGTWQTNGATARTTTNNRDANIVMDLTTVDVSMVVTVTPLGPNPRPGVTFNDDGNDNMLLLYSDTAGGTLTLFTYFGPTRVSIASATGIGPAGTPFELRVTTNGPNITVFVNGSLRIGVVLAGANLCLAKDTGCAGDGQPNVGYGIWADRDTTSVFDDFRLESV